MFFSLSTEIRFNPMTAQLESTEFYAKDLIDALAKEGVTAVVFQSGGNTATITTLISQSDHEAFLIGPGSYNWDRPGQSIFTTDELSYGEDQYDAEGELKDEDPESFYIVPETAIADVAKEIAEAYRKRNNI